MPSKELERHHPVMGHMEEMHRVNQLSHGNSHVDYPEENTDIKLNQSLLNCIPLDVLFLSHDIMLWIFGRAEDATILMKTPQKNYLKLFH